MKSAGVVLCLVVVGFSVGAARSSAQSLCIDGDCSAILSAADGSRMDGSVNLDPPILAVDGQGIQRQCTVTEGQPQPTPWKQRHWSLMGPGVVPGQPYRVVLRLWGVVECKTYPTGSPRSPYLGNDASYNLWISNCSDNGDHWNTHAFTVTPQPSSTIAGMGFQRSAPPRDQTYCINQCPAGVPESHRTWKVDSVYSIVVPGGAYINFLEFDTNCRGILNCGVSSDSAGICNDHYMIAIPGTTVPPPPPAILNQPPAAGAGAFGQWWFLDVVDVSPI
jgi:hypothetical protein